LGIGWFVNAPHKETKGNDQTPASYYAFHVDVEGWYRTTPHEAALLAPHDLGVSALPHALPLRLGPWHGRDLAPDSQIETWYEDPDLVLRRRYTKHGEIIWLTAIGSHGAKSFHLFEHTPPICYASTGWRTREDMVKKVALEEGMAPVHRALFERRGERHLTYYWYQWNTPTRDAAEGIISWRLTTDVRDTMAEADDRLAAFLRLLYRQQITWHRF
jgi:hypothetical protein